MRREAQARKIAYYFSEVDRAPEDVRGKYTKWWIHEVHNLSDEPIYRVQHHEIHGDIRWPVQVRFREVLLPGQSFRMQEGYYPSKSRREVHFFDNSGRPWIRTLRGDLKELRRLKEWWREVKPLRPGFRANMRIEHELLEQDYLKFLQEHPEDRREQ